MPCNTSQQNNGLRTLNGYNIFPATPILLNRLGVNSPNFINARNIEIQNKTDNSITDIRLRDYQNCAVNFLIKSKNKGLAIFDEQRLGKTPTVLTALKIKQAKAIIIVPKSLLYQWSEEYKVWYNNDVTIIDGNVANRHNLYKTAKSSIILTYNTALADVDIITKLKHFNYIVIDEAHRIRNIKKSKKYKPELAKAVIKIAKNIENKIALTGTPAPNAADDIFGILHFLYPDIFSSYYAFCDYYFIQEDCYAKIKGIPTSIKKCTGTFKPYKDKELLEFIETISIQRKRKEVMKWLPKYNITKIPLPMANAQKAAYEELSKYYEYSNHVYLDTLGIILAQRQLAMAPEILDCPHQGCKFDYILDYLQDYPEKSIIIVSTLLEPLKLLRNKLPNTVHSQFLTGETTSKQRDTIKKDFQNKKCKLILANLNVIKEGFTLDSAHTIIFLDSSYVYTDNLQCMDRLVPTAEDRVHKEIQDIILLIAQDTIDEYIYDMVYNKKATSADIINNYKKILERKQQ